MICDGQHSVLETALTKHYFCRSQSCQVRAWRCHQLGKARCRQKLCDEFDNDPWEMGYKLVTQGLGARLPLTIIKLSAMANIVDVFFPTHLVWLVGEFMDLGPIILFSREQLCRSIVLQQRSGPWRHPPCQGSEELLFETKPRILFDTYNACFKEAIFYSVWKATQLVYIPNSKGYPGPLQHTARLRARHSRLSPGQDAS